MNEYDFEDKIRQLISENIGLYDISKDVDIEIDDIFSDRDLDSITTDILSLNLDALTHEEITQNLKSILENFMPSYIDASIDIDYEDVVDDDLPEKLMLLLKGSISPEYDDRILDEYDRLRELHPNIPKKELFERACTYYSTFVDHTKKQYKLGNHK